jgi:putative serine protease PepD
MISEREPQVAAEAEPEATAGARPARGFGPAALVAAILVAALSGGAVAGAVTLTILARQARTNPQTVDLRNQVTISASDAVTNVAAKALPAVVSIVTGATAAGAPTAGTGFLVTSDGYVVTAIPVVAGSSKLQVLVPGDAKPHLAHLVDYDCPAGFAVLKADGVAGAPTLGFGDSGALKMGETVIALGGRLQGPQVAPAVVSGLYTGSVFPNPTDSTRSVAVSDAILTSQRLLAGAAGAPLLNVGGQVVGLLLPAAAGEPTTAVAAAMLQPGVQQIVSGSQLSVAGLGARWQDLLSAQAAASGSATGAQLASVTAGGAAAEAGLKAGDVITQVDEVHIDDAHPLALALRSRFQPGQRVTITYVRASTAAQLQLTLDSEHPSCA